MTRDAPIRPHHTGIEVVIQLGPTATVQASDDGVPVVEIRWGSITVVVMPRSVVDDEPIVACDLQRARDLHAATGTYLQAIKARWDRQQTAVTGAADQLPPGDRDGDHD